MISPTGSNAIRNDVWGSGIWGAARRKKDGTSYFHRGIDFICEPNQNIVAPMSGIFSNAYPYSDLSYGGCRINSKGLEIKMFYFKPIHLYLKQQHVNVKAGQVIGQAQDISLRYQDKKRGKMIPHIHLEITGIDPLSILRAAEALTSLCKIVWDNQGYVFYPEKLSD